MPRMPQLKRFTRRDCLRNLATRLAENPEFAGVSLAPLARKPGILRVRARTTPVFCREKRVDRTSRCRLCAGKQRS